MLLDILFAVFFLSSKFESS
jgi:ribose 5-phosphate isomerase B